MKKIIALVLVLSLLSVGAFCMIGNTVNSQKDAVTIRENVLFGDKSYAFGANVLTEAHYDNHLFWNTDYTIGEEPICKTKYDFSYNERMQSGVKRYNGLMLDIGLKYGYDLKTPVEELKGLAKAYRELYDETPMGSTGKKTIYLQDYYTYYPVHIAVELPGVIWQGNDYEYLSPEQQKDEHEVWTKFIEFFKIPIPDDLGPIEINITKEQNRAGTGSSQSATYVDYYFNLSYAYTDNQCFFSINNRMSGKSGVTSFVDTSLIPGGYGIYSFKYMNVRNDANTKSNMTIYQNGYETGVDEDSLAMVYPLEKETIIKDMTTSEDYTKLYLFTLENDASYLTEIDIATMTEVQKHKICAGSYDQVWSRQDFFLMKVSDHFILLAKNDEGSYEIKFNEKMQDKVNEEFAFVRTSATMDYDGNKLIIVDTLYEETYRTLDLCGFYTAVYNSDGLVYYGEYESSLSLTPDTGRYYANCLPEKIEVKWK